MNRRHLLVVAAVDLAGALLFPSMAAPLTGYGDQIARTDIVLEPYGGPNGAYAVMYDQDGDGDEELGLDFSASNSAVDGDGVNAGSLTPVHRVFVIENTGDEPATVYLTDDNDEITFYRDDDSSTSLEGRENAVPLGSEQTVAVGVLIDTRDGDGVETVEQFTVHADPIESETEIEESGGDDNGDDGGDSGDGDADISILSTPTDTPTGDDDTGGTDTPTTNESDADDDTETSGASGGEGDIGTNETTTTVTVEQTGTTLSPAETAAERQDDPGTSGDAGVTLGGLPWWLVLLALLVAALIAGYGYRRLGA